MRWSGAVLLLVFVISGLSLGQETPPPTSTPTTAPTATPTATPAATPAATPTATPTPPAQDPKSQDTLPIPAILESWYQVLQGVEKEHTGYFHERIEPNLGGGAAKYDYLFEAEYDYVAKSANGEDYLRITERLDGQLEKDFGLFFGSYVADINGVKYTLSVNSYPDQDRRTIATEIPGESEKDPPVKREYETEMKEALHIRKNTLIFMLRQTGQLKQTGNLRFKTTSFHDKERLCQVAVKSVKSQVVIEKSVPVTPVTIDDTGVSFFPNLTKFLVDKYGRVVEGTVRDELFTVKLVKDSETARPTGKGGLEAKRRDDPFMKSRALTSGVIKETKNPKGPVTDGRGPAKIEEPPKEFPKALSRAQALVEQLREEMQKGMNAEAAQTYQTILSYYDKLYRLISDPVDKPKIQKLKDEAEKYYGGAALLFAEAKQRAERINDAYNSDNLELIDRELAGLNELKSRPEFIRDPHAALLEQLIRDANKKRMQAQARIELSKKAISLTGTISYNEEVLDTVKVELMLGGSRVVVSEPVRGFRRTSYAVVTAGGVTDAYREGDTIPNEGIKIDKIYRSAIQISYKGEVREVSQKK